MAGDPDSAFELAQLLARHGRGSQAIDVMRVPAGICNGGDWVLHALAALCLARSRRPEEGLAQWALPDGPADAGTAKTWYAEPTGAGNVLLMFFQTLIYE
ncbi:hypothetical protein JHN59_35450 [Streptomyces sp. MBT49]|uniref:hypothetical protein n=1 Tax=Streptomyces sp. MBT49 TaxID=1488380 RepID=UPI0019096796|nr:hypothetical protein [Streptomyces sp. MBT49]MBK3630006.1 hypothetical protein [Streptomyces sp. MBT49]